MDSDDRASEVESRFNFQKRLFEKSFEQLQTQIIHLDDILFKIKTSAITVWTALMGWSFTTKVSSIFSLGFVVIIGFWLIEAMFKGVQIRSIESSQRLMRLVNDSEALDKQFESRNFDGGLIYPVSRVRTERERLILIGLGLISPTVATVYLFLCLANWLICSTLTA